MKRAFQAGVIGCLTLLLFAASAPASASDWFWGGGFRIGGFRFEIGHRHDLGGYGGAYYRVTQRIPSRYRCSDRCYIDRGVYYHHATCPVIHGYFRSQGYTAYRVYDRYAPRAYYRYDRRDHNDRYDRYRARSHRYDRYDRNDRYDRRHDRRHDRYDRRHRRDDRHDRDWRDRRHRRSP